MVYTGTSWWFTIFNVYQGLEGFHADIVQHSSMKVINFTSNSRNFILKLFWMVWQNCSISPQSSPQFTKVHHRFFERIIYQHSWERIHNDFVLDCSKKILEFTTFWCSKVKSSKVRKFESFHSILDSGLGLTGFQIQVLSFVFSSWWLTHHEWVIFLLC